MATQTHYEALKVSRSATMSEIKAAYRAILLANHEGKTHHLPPFARSLAERCLRTATAAWEVLSNPVEKQEYDATLPYLDPADDAWGTGNTYDGLPSRCLLQTCPYCRLLTFADTSPTSIAFVIDAGGNMFRS